MSWLERAIERHHPRLSVALAHSMLFEIKSLYFTDVKYLERLRRKVDKSYPPDKWDDDVYVAPSQEPFFNAN